jgi:hypothetical protein
MPLVKLPFLPGINKDDSELLNEGGWSDGNWVRFRANSKKGHPELVGGYQAASLDSFRGICRGLLTYENLDNEKIAIIGTNTSLWALRDGTLQNITPEASADSFGTDPLSTTDGDATVEVTLTAHGMNDGTYAYISGLTATGGVTIGGGSGNFAASPFQTLEGSKRVIVTLAAHGMATGDFCTISGVTGTLNGVAASEFNKRHSVYVLGTDNFQIDVVTEATATGSGGGGTPAYALYYGYPVTVVDANTFSVEASSAATSTATGGGASGLYVLEINIGLVNTIARSGYGTGQYGTGFYGYGISQDPFFARIWSMQSFGEIAVVAIRGGAIYQWQNNFSDRATILSVPPQQVGSVLVTPERFTFALGSSDVGASSNFDPLRIRWSRISGLNTTGDWTPGATSSAGFFDPLGEGTRIIGGISMPFVSLIWTDTAVYQIRYQGQAPSNIWSLELLGTGCGLIGPNAVARIGNNSGVMWLSSSRQWWQWAPGNVPQEVTCPVRDFFFDNLEFLQEYKVYAGTNGQFNEVWFWYPHDSLECNRYVSYDYRLGVWSIGQLGRTAWADRGVQANPIATGTDGRVYTHEKGLNADGSQLVGFIESSYSDIQDGENQIFINRVLPDIKEQRGPVNMTLTARDYPNGSEVSTGALLSSASTEQVDMQLLGRSVKVKYEWNSAPAAGRIGDMRFDIRPTGIRR